MYRSPTGSGRRARIGAPYRRPAANLAAASSSSGRFLPLALAPQLHISIGETRPPVSLAAARFAKRLSARPNYAARDPAARRFQAAKRQTA